jgi:NitT/TauT family transport system ATP-binding protein
MASPAPISKARALIEVKALNKRYPAQRGRPVIALEDINFSIGEGEFLTVVGPSGCGKTTLLKILAGLVPATSGTMLLAGSRIEGPRRDVGIVFQNAVLLPWRTVTQNTMLPVEVQGLDRGKFGARAQGLIEMVGLGGFEDKYPFELSGGMQQRNSIVRALVNDPAVLLMDEPFGALDAMTRENMNVELQRIWMEAKKTVFFITHSIAEAVFLGDRVVVMTPRPGRIAQIYDVDIPRPRTLDVMATPEFVSTVQSIRRHFDTKGHLD